MTAKVAGRRWRVAGAVVAALVAFGVASVVAFNASMRRHDEMHRAAALRDDLAQMRAAIGKYRATHGHYPASLEELVPDDLRKIAADPITRSTDWRLTMREDVRVDDFTSTSAAPHVEVVDVHSSATGHDSKGKAWSDY